jgi:hypothetical protein
MRWNLTQSTGQFNRWKLEQNESAEIKYNKESHSFRITANDKRLFFLDKTGFLQNRFLIRTEYNIIAGEILPKKSQSGLVIFENKKYNYLIQEDLVAVYSKKGDFSLTIAIDGTAVSDQTEIYALLFGTLRLAVAYQAESKSVLA